MTDPLKQTPDVELDRDNLTGKRKRPVVLQAGVGDKDTLHPRVFRVRLDAGQVEQLYRHAADRGLEADALLTEIIRTILNDQLIDAVIADGALGDMTKRRKRKAKEKAPAA